MTALNFMLDQKAICIAMDTLGTNAETGKPSFYTSKIFPLLHLNGVICGTGLGSFVHDWFVYVNTAIIARDMEHLNQFVTEPLRKLAEGHHINNDSSVTIYHFGYSENHQCFRGYAYRSSNNYESEELIYGFGIKPEISYEIPPPINLPEDFIKIVIQQKIEDEKLPFEKKVGIGGEVHFLYMTPGKIIMTRCHKFDDYLSMYEEMCKNIIKK